MTGFNIDITKDEVSVSAGDRGWPPDWSAIVMFLFETGLALYVIANVLMPLSHWSISSNWPLMPATIFFAGSLLWSGLRQFFPSGESLRCDHNTLVIGRIPQTSLRGHWAYETFPIEKVEEVQFAAVRLSRSGAGMGLKFKVGGKVKKVLAGLESPEAARILSGLESLGLPVVHDPAMPMMIEMALSRRKH